MLMAVTLRRQSALRWAAVLLCAMLAGSLPAADVVRDILARVPSEPRSFDRLMSDLAALPATGRCTLTTLGKTPEGRPLVMAEVTDPTSTYPQVTMFIIARQHGSEAAGSESTLAILQQFAAAPTGLEKEILKYLRIVAIPVANPDGAANHRRDNANGVDLNRDWASLSQPETRLIAAAVRHERPDAILDFHELPASSSKSSYQENFLETIGSCASLPPQLCRRAKQISAAMSTWLRTFGYALNVYYDYPGDSLALCHRYFGLKQQFPTFLCEAKNGPGRTLPVRAGMHVVAALVVGNYLMHDGIGPAPKPATPKPADPSPGAKPLDAAKPPPPPEPVSVHLSLEPAADKSKGPAHLQVRVQGGEEFSYVELSVGGKTRALSNLRENKWPLNLGTLPAGNYQVKVTAYGPGEMELASQEIAVRVTADSVLAAQ